jgi:putative hydrolase of the HAD superfamily
VLDAMGVVFSAGDDLAELLVPFVQEAGGADAQAVVSAYLAASLGTMSADAFWRAVRLKPDMEDAYLAKHSLVSGVVDVLECARRADMPVWCLSNDVERWSRKLRGLLGIEVLFAGAVISSEVGVRKPDQAIYRCLVDRSGFEPHELFFVDDRPRNVEAAITAGIPAVRFDALMGYRQLKRQLFGST